jgi:hypothetical protein
MIFYEKLAEKQQESRQTAEQRERGRALLGAMGVIGGGAALRGSAPLVTGRRTLYHGTSKAGADAIRREGLTPGMARDADGDFVVRGGNVMDAVTPKDFMGNPEASFGNFESDEQRDKFFNTVEQLRNTDDPDEIERLKAELPRGRGGRGSVYLEGSRLGARFYANQQAEIAEGGIDPDALKEMQQKINPFRLRDDADVVRARIPYSLERKMIENPEVAFHEDITLKDPLLSPGQKEQLEAAMPKLKGAYVLPGGLGSEYIVGSDDFKSHSLDEFKDYLSNNKGRFAKGVGLAGVGALAAGAGAREIYRQYKRRQEKRAGLAYDREKFERDSRGLIGGMSGLTLGTGAGLYGGSKFKSPVARYGATFAAPMLGAFAGRALGKALPASGKYDKQDALIEAELKANLDPTFRESMINDYGLKGYKRRQEKRAGAWAAWG